MAAVKASGGAGEDGVRLCQSYAAAFAPAPGTPPAERRRAAASHGVHLGYTRFFLPPAVYRRNRLPPAGLWALHPLAQFPFVFAAETLRRTFPPLERVADRVARWRRDRWFAHHMRGRSAEYKPVESFTR
jgi:hypothetical protein